MKRYDFEYSPHQAVYYILDRTRGHGDYRPYDRAMAKTQSAYDAERIVDALNAAEAPV